MRKTRTSGERQKEIFQYIKTFLLEKGYPPSVREIGKAVGLNIRIFKRVKILCCKVTRRFTEQPHAACLRKS